MAIDFPNLLSVWRRRRTAEPAYLGSTPPATPYPRIDAASCIGCGGCASACPEGDVLGVVGGIGVVIDGLRCVGHGDCAIACPVGAIEVSPSGGPRVDFRRQPAASPAPAV